MTVSVVIPNYNHSPFLKKRIDSVLEQTYTDFEVIILDDKSPDNSKDIIDTYTGHPKVSHIVYNETNSGSPFRQWKKGIDLAKGEYIWIAESDDYSDCTFLEKLMSSIEANNSILCICASNDIDNEDHIFYQRSPFLRSQYIGSYEFVKNYLLYQNNIYNAGMAVFRKSAIDKIDWDKIYTFKYCGDWMFWSEYLINNQGNVSEVKEYLNYYRSHSANVTTNAQKNGLNFLEGFIISKYITYKLNVKRSKTFCRIWFDLWLDLKKRFAFDGSINRKIWFMFLKEQPYIAYLAVKKFVSNKI